MERVHGDGVQHAAGELADLPVLSGGVGRDRTHRRFRIRAGTHQTGVHRADGGRRVRHPATGLRQRETGRRGRSRPDLDGRGQDVHTGRGLGWGWTDQAQRQRPGLVQRGLQVVQQNPLAQRPWATHRTDSAATCRASPRCAAGVLAQPSWAAHAARTASSTALIATCVPRTPKVTRGFPAVYRLREAGRMEDHRISRRPDVRRYRRPATSRSPIPHQLAGQGPLLVDAAVAGPQDQPGASAEEPLSASRHSPDLALRSVWSVEEFHCCATVPLHVQICTAVPAVVPPLRASRPKVVALHGLVVGQRPRLRGGAVAGVQLRAGAGDRVTVVMSRTCRRYGDLAVRDARQRGDLGSHLVRVTAGRDRVGLGVLVPRVLDGEPVDRDRAGVVRQRGVQRVE